MKIQRSYGVIVLVAFLVGVAGVLLLLADYRAEVASHRAIVVARAQTTLDALVAGIRAHGRMGRFRHERLSIIFEELAHAPDILAISLYGSEEEPIATGGEPGPAERYAGDSPQWEHGVLRMMQPVALDLGGHGPGPGMGRRSMEDSGDWDPLPSGPYWVAVSLDSHAMERKISRERLRGIGAIGVLVVMVISVAVAAFGWLRRRDLQLALLVAQEQGAHQEHLTLLGAGLAHETKNPLGIIRGQAQLIADGGEEDGVAACRERAKIIVDEIDRTVGQIDGFLTLARPHAVTRTPVRIRELLASLESMLSDEVAQHGVTLSIMVDDREVLADEGQLRRALLNLVLNALQASTTGGHIEIEVGGPSASTTITVRDEGHGIAPEDMPRVTEPYFTRSKTGGGLGLALVKQIVTAHGWTLGIQSDLGVGTAVSISGIENGKGDVRA